MAKAEVAEYRVLGTFEVRSDGRSVPLGPPKQRALLAILLLRANETVPTDRLIELLWGERAPRTATHSVQIYVSELRKALERAGATGAIVTRPRGTSSRSRPTRSTRAGSSQALNLWRGPPLSDLLVLAVDQFRELTGDTQAVAQRRSAEW